MQRRLQNAVDVLLSLAAPFSRYLESKAFAWRRIRIRGGKCCTRLL